MHRIAQVIPCTGDLSRYTILCRLMVPDYLFTYPRSNIGQLGQVIPSQGLFQGAPSSIYRDVARACNLLDIPLNYGRSFRHTRNAANALEQKRQILPILSCLKERVICSEGEMADLGAVRCFQLGEFG